MLIGCHVSVAGGLHNAPLRAAELGCETFQMFTRSPQGGKAAPVTVQTVSDFKSEMEKSGIAKFVVHTPYYINFGSAAKNIYYGSVAVIKDELERATQLGAEFVITHLGTYKDLGEERGAEQVLSGLVAALEGCDGSSKLLIEIAAGSGSVIGATFEQLSRFSSHLRGIAGFGGVCFDTQHAFASGYAISERSGIKKTFDDFDAAIGLDLLRMSHINDSLVELGGKRDRHEHIGEGKIGETGFSNFMDFWKGFEASAGQEKSLILETEHDKVKSDIEKLKAIRGKLA